MDKGIYTDKPIMLSGLSENKHRIASEIAADITSKILFAFGDTESDIPLFRCAKHSFINGHNRFWDSNDVYYIKFEDMNSDEIILSKMETVLSASEL